MGKARVREVMTSGRVRARALVVPARSLATMARARGKAPAPGRVLETTMAPARAKVQAVRARVLELTKDRARAGIKVPAALHPGKAIRTTRKTTTTTAPARTRAGAVLPAKGRARAVHNRGMGER
jgi:hypothetical protein